MIAEGRLRLVGDIDEVLEEHRWVVGSPIDAEHLPAAVEVVSRSDHDRHSRLLVRSSGPLFNPALTATTADLDDVVMAYLETASEPSARLTHTTVGKS